MFFWRFPFPIKKCFPTLLQLMGAYYISGYTLLRMFVGVLLLSTFWGMFPGSRFVFGFLKTAVKPVSGQFFVSLGKGFAPTLFSLEDNNRLFSVFLDRFHPWQSAFHLVMFFVKKPEKKGC
mmetsp:Transcript_63824/g.74752  ORF Transcript_63824/g.74752 Transcript_63824/m.74752 type:complete len:121 (+) Transcript_63824:53-415(+)